MIPEHTHSPVLLRLVVPPDFVEDLEHAPTAQAFVQRYQLTVCWLLATWGSTVIASVAS